MEYLKRERIINILEEYSALIGVDSSEITGLISEMKQIRTAIKDGTVESSIKEELAEMCESLDYNLKEHNGSRMSEYIAMRDAMTRMVAIKYKNYTRLPVVIGSFFGKDRSTGYAMINRSEISLEVKYDIFMHFYNKLLTYEVLRAA